MRAISPARPAPARDDTSIAPKPTTRAGTPLRREGGEGDFDQDLETTADHALETTAGHAVEATTEHAVEFRGERTAFQEGLMAYECILVEQEQGVAIVTLNRPDKLNAMNRPADAELHDAVTRASADDAVGCIVITGAANARSRRAATSTSSARTTAR